MSERRRFNRAQQRKRDEAINYYTDLLVEFHAKWKKVSEVEIGEHFTMLDNRWRQYCKTNKLTSNNTRKHPIEDSFNYEISGIWKTEQESQAKVKDKELDTTPPTLSPSETKKED